MKTHSKREVSIKLVDGGNNLSMTVKRIELRGESLDNSQIQSVCTDIGKRYGIPAVPNNVKERQEILIPASCHIPVRTIPVSEWLITPSDPIETLTIYYKSNSSKQLLADLYKRALLLNGKKPFWTLDTPRILYERTSFVKQHDISVVRRFEVSEVLLEEGLGFSVGLTTAFFAIRSVLDFFERQDKELFDRITNRQSEQQGTLLYKGPNGNSKCYFVKYGYEKKLCETPSFSEGKNEYANAYEYYRTKYPNFDVSPNDRVAMVSFPGMAKQVYVPAKRLFPRIFNTELVGDLQNIDKIGANEKRKYLESNFWSKMGKNPFGNGFAGIAKDFFSPSTEKTGIIPLPGIIMGKNVIVPPPAGMNSKAYKDHFKQRKLYLDKYGCFYIPPTLSGSKIYFVFSDKISDQIRRRYVDDIMNYINRLTRNEIEFDVIILPTYQNYLQATVSLKNDHESGMVVFIFDDENPAVYSLIDFELKGWNLKRATSRELLRKYKILSKTFQLSKADPSMEKAKRDWDSYIEMTTLGIIQKLGCVPFTVQPDLFNYGMQIVIDVSEDFSHFSISGLIQKESMMFPLMPCHTERKTDGKKETINPEILYDEIIKMFTALKKTLNKHLVLKYLFCRDGKDCGEEYKAIKRAFSQLIADRVIPQESIFDFVEYHKTTRKEVRMWDVDENENATNVLEGSFYLFRPTIAILCSTGDGTLSPKVTADPITIVNKYTNANIEDVLNDVFYGAQFNFSNPRVAQKHSLPMKRADDELTEKRAQEIKRIK